MECKVDHVFNCFSAQIAAPLIVGVITGGELEATKIVTMIAEAVEEPGSGISVESQRAAKEQKQP